MPYEEIAAISDETFNDILEKAESEYESAQAKRREEEENRRKELEELRRKAAEYDAIKQEEEQEKKAAEAREAIQEQNTSGAAEVEAQATREISTPPCAPSEIQGCASDTEKLETLMRQIREIEIPQMQEAENRELAREVGWLLSCAEEIIYGSDLRLGQEIREMLREKRQNRKS